MYLFVILHNIYIYMYMYMYGFIMCIFIYIYIYIDNIMYGYIQCIVRRCLCTCPERCRTYATSLRPQCSSFTMSMACLSQSWGQPSYRCDAAIDLPGFDILFHIFIEQNLMSANIRATKPSNQWQPRASTLTTFQIRTWDRHESGMRHSKRISVAQRMINDLWFGVLRS